MKLIITFWNKAKKILIEDELIGILLLFTFGLLLQLNLGDI